MTVTDHRVVFRTPIYAAAWILAVLALAVGGAKANDEPPPSPEAEKAAAKEAGGELNDGRLIRIRLPLVGNADAHIKTTIQRAIEQLAKSPHRQGRRPILVLELVPARKSSGFGEGTDFERAVSVARYLTSQD